MKIIGGCAVVREVQAELVLNPRVAGQFQREALANYAERETTG
jgi:hypothetical protein